MSDNAYADFLVKEIRKALSQLGVPEMGYTGRVAEAIETLQKAVEFESTPVVKQRKARNSGTETNS